MDRIIDQIRIQSYCLDVLEKKSFFLFLFDYNSLNLYSLGKLFAQVVKLVDTPDLGSGAERCGGSSPFLGIQRLKTYVFSLFLSLSYDPFS